MQVIDHCGLGHPSIVPLVTPRPPLVPVPPRRPSAQVKPTRVTSGAGRVDQSGAPSDQEGSNEGRAPTSPKQQVS